MPESLVVAHSHRQITKTTHVVGASDEVLVEAVSKDMTDQEPDTAATAPI